MRRQWAEDLRTWKMRAYHTFLVYFLSPCDPFFCSCSCCPFSLFVVAAADCCLWAFGHARKEKKKWTNFFPDILVAQQSCHTRRCRADSSKKFAKPFAHCWSSCERVFDAAENKVINLNGRLKSWAFEHSLLTLFFLRKCARDMSAEGKLMMANDEKLELSSPSSLLANEYKFQLSQRVSSLHGEWMGGGRKLETNLWNLEKVGSRCRTHLSPQKFHFYEYSSRNNSQVVFWYFLFLKLYTTFFIAFDPEISCCCGCWKYAITTPYS